METDNYFMSLALKLAQENLGNVAHNPTVGCVIVKNGKIIGQGCTSVGGRPHAEAVAIMNAQIPLDDATMYTSLEPCCHHGGTGGPCTLDIIKSRIAKVVIAVTDPDERVSGKGIKALKKAGIKIKYGIMEEEAKKLNIGFFLAKKLGRPLITCKVAATLDGKIATYTGKSRWITSKDTRDWVHKLRSKYDAIMIGSNTLIDDDPLLTCRLPGLEEKSPTRLIIDSQARLNADHNVAKTADKIKTWIITNNEVRDKINHINYLIVNTNAVGKVCLKDMVAKITTKIGVTRLLVEGGGILITELLKQQLIDELIICRSGKVVGNNGVPFIGSLEVPSIDKCYQFKKSEIIELNNDIIEVFNSIIDIIKNQV